MFGATLNPCTCILNRLQEWHMAVNIYFPIETEMKTRRAAKLKTWEKLLIVSDFSSKIVEYSCKKKTEAISPTYNVNIIIIIHFLKNSLSGRRSNMLQITLYKIGDSAAMPLTIPSTDVRNLQKVALCRSFLTTTTKLTM